MKYTANVNNKQLDESFKTYQKDMSFDSYIPPQIDRHEDKKDTE